MQTMESLLAQHAFFTDLEARHRQLIAGCASNIRFDAGETIFQEGEDASQFYLIRHGKVALEILVPGRGSITIQTIEAGDILGWSWLFSPYRWHFKARAIELTRAFALDGKCLRGKCEEDHDLGYEFLKRFARVMEQRLQATRLQLLDLYNVRS